MSQYQSYSIDGIDKTLGSERTLLSSHYMYLPDPTYAELDYRASWVSSLNRKKESDPNTLKPSDIIRDEVTDDNDLQIQQLYDPCYIQTNEFIQTSKNDKDVPKRRSKVVVSIVNDEPYPGYQYPVKLVNGRAPSNGQNQYIIPYRDKNLSYFPQEPHKDNIVYDGMVEGYHYELTDNYTVWSIDKKSHVTENRKHDLNEKVPTLQKIYSANNNEPSHSIKSDSSGINNELQSLSITMLSPNKPSSKQVINISHNRRLQNKPTESIGLSATQTSGLYKDKDHNMGESITIEEEEPCISEEVKEEYSYQNIRKSNTVDIEDREDHPVDITDNNSDILVTNLDDIDINDLLMDNGDMAESDIKLVKVVPPLDLTYLNDTIESDTESTPPVAPRGNASRLETLTLDDRSATTTAKTDTESTPHATPHGNASPLETLILEERSKTTPIKTDTKSTDASRLKSLTPEKSLTTTSVKKVSNDKKAIKTKQAKPLNGQEQSKKATVTMELDHVVQQPVAQIYRPTMKKLIDPYVGGKKDLIVNKYNHSWLGKSHLEDSLSRHRLVKRSPVLSRTLETIPESPNTMPFGLFLPMLRSHEAGLISNTKNNWNSLNTKKYYKPHRKVDKGIEDNPPEGIGCCGYVLLVFSWILIILTLPVSLCLCIKVVQEYERAVIFRLGRLLPGGAKGPGLFFITPCMDNYIKVDLRTVTFDVPPQEVLSKDSVTVAVDAVVYYRISNATVSVTNVEDANRSTRLLAATTLRNTLGTKNLSEILSDRENISHMMQSSLDEATDPWGVKVERVEIKDVRLPVQLQRAMAAEAEAAREARAKVIAAEGEHKASRALKDAADIINESPSALQLRYLQTLNTISAEKNSTIIFPLPIDLVQGLIKK